MDKLSNKEIKAYMTEFESSPGYVLNLTRADFEALVDNSIDIDIEDMQTSNGKRLKYLLKTCTTEQVDTLVAALREIS